MCDTELRYDTDGRAYTKAEFVEFYGNTQRWDSAPRARPKKGKKQQHPQQEGWGALPFVPAGGYHKEDENDKPHGEGFEDHFFMPKRLRDKSAELILSVNDWHYAMLNDHPRNEFYKRALKQVIVPGETRVLEIGAGSGLLSLIAASLGAKSVVAIEANVHLVQLAQRIIKANGYSDRIRVIHAMSTEVGLKRIGGPCDVLLSEIFGTLLLGESALHYVSDARQRLIKPGAPVVPGQGTQYATLVESADLQSITSASQWEGIDLRPFNQLQDTTTLVFSKMHGFRFNFIKHTMMSEAIPILAVDFSKDRPGQYPLESRHRFKAKKDGVIHAVLATWEAESESAGRMSTHPQDTVDNFPRDMHWGQGIQLVEDHIASANSPDPIPFTVKEGEEIDLIATFSSDLVALQFRLERVK